LCIIELGDFTLILFKTLTEKQKRKRLYSKSEKFEVNGIPAGLKKSHKIIRTERDKEIQFMKLCSQIKLEDFRSNRAENQRLDRRQKRNK